MLQAVELLVAFVLVDTAIHVTRGGEFLVVAAAVLAVLALTARGPLGVVRLVPARIHVPVVTTGAVLLALCPVVPALRPEVEGIIVVEVAALGLLRLATLTRTVPGPAPLVGAPGVRWRDATVVDASATPGPATPGPTTPPGPPAATTTTAPAPAASRTSPTPAAGGGVHWARRLGRASGGVAAQGRRVGARYGPEAKARTKASLRDAGRVAGRLRSSLADDGAGTDDDRPSTT